MHPLPLRLALEPVLPTRTATAGDSFEYGYRLRLPGGPLLRSDDPLLRAFGASVDWPLCGERHEEALQDRAFDPGRAVRLIGDELDPEDAGALGLWNLDGLRQGATVGQASSAMAQAGAEVGLEYGGVVLWEIRSGGDDRREGICVLLHASALVHVEMPPPPLVERPLRRSRPRLVLVADASGGLRWWDAATSAGPLEAGDLPLSHDLRQDLDGLRKDCAALADADEDVRGFERIEASWEREELEGRVAALWRRARVELGRRYAVGFLAPGMPRPVWSPDELPEPEDDEIPF